MNIKRILPIALLCLCLLACGKKTEENKAGTENSQGDTKDPQAAAIENATMGSMQDYWNFFKDAMLKKDMATLKKICTFPIESRGPMDEDPIYQITEADFEKVMGAVLNQPSGLNTTNFDETVLQYIEKNKDKGLEADRIACFQFSKKDGKNMLSLVYIEYDTYEKAGIKYGKK